MRSFPARFSPAPWIFGDVRLYVWYKPCSGVLLSSLRPDASQLSEHSDNALPQLACHYRMWTEALARNLEYLHVEHQRSNHTQTWPYPNSHTQQRPQVFFGLHIHTVGNSQPWPYMEQFDQWMSNKMRNHLHRFYLKCIWEYWSFVNDYILRMSCYSSFSL